MVAWLIIGHGLWEKAEHGKRPKDAALYNAATALTLGVAVLCGYAALFVLLFGVGGAAHRRRCLQRQRQATPPGSAPTRRSPGSARRSARSPAHSAPSSRTSTRYATRPTGTTSAAVENRPAASADAPEKASRLFVGRAACARTVPNGPLWRMRDLSSCGDRPRSRADWPPHTCSCTSLSAGAIGGWVLALLGLTRHSR